MNCQAAESLLHAYFDDELDLANSLEIEEHLGTCAACSRRLARERSLRARLAAASLSFPTPPNLRENITLVLDRPESPSKRVTRHWRDRVRSLAPLTAAAALLVSAILITTRPSEEQSLAGQIRDGHVRSLMAAHLADVESTDRHTVKPWFAGKLSFSPWVGDLSEEGFPLIGGRLDYLDNRPLAAVVFKRRKHIINLFMWPSQSTGAESARVLTRDGYQVVHWSDASMTYWAISDLNAGELQEFVNLVQSRASRRADGAVPASESE